MGDGNGGGGEQSGNPGVGCARKRVSGAGRGWRGKGDRRSRAHPVPGALRVGEKFNPPG